MSYNSISIGSCIFPYIQTRKQSNKTYFVTLFNHSLSSNHSLPITKHFKHLNISFLFSPFSTLQYFFTGTKRGRSTKGDSKRAARKAQSKKARNAKTQIKVGNPCKSSKKSFRYEMKSKSQRKITGKINNNIEALMAAKVMKMEGHFAMKDLRTAGTKKQKILNKIQKDRETKHKKRHIKPEKVNVPRI